MNKRILVSATLATALATIAFVGCGGSSASNGNNGGDGGGSGQGDSGSQTTLDGATQSDGGAGKSGDSGSTTGNPPLPDGSILPHGNQLVPSTTLTLDGVTSDDYAIYTDSSSNTVSAISLATGSKAISLGPVDSNNDVTVSGKVVVIGTTLDNNGFGSASIWTSALTASAALSTTINFYSLAVSSDGSHVAFYEGNTTTGSVSVAGSDGTGKVALVTGLNVTDSFCYPSIGYAGTNVVAAYCTSQTIDAGEPDGGTDTNQATVSLFAPGSTTAIPVATDVQDVFAASASAVVVVGATGSVSYPITGSTVGAAVPIDANAALGAVTYTPGLITPDGSHLIYTTTAQALKRAATTSPADPTQLVASGYSDLWGLSPDGNWVVGTLNQGNHGTSDLYFASATAAGASTALSAATTGNFQGDLFTVDSTHVLYLTAYGQTGGTLNAAAVTAPGTATVLGTNAIAELATSGAKVIFGANFNSTTYASDLLGADTSQTAAPTVIVNAADPGFFLNNEKTMLVYTWSYESGASAGLWVLAVP